MKTECRNGHSLFIAGRRSDGHCTLCARANSSKTYQRNREKSKERSRIWRKNNRKRWISYATKWNKNNPVKAAWAKYKHSAKSRNIVFSLERLHLNDLVTDNCYYCLASTDPVNGIDRVDNSRGYEEDNVVTCCFTCNHAKSAMSLQQFSEWVRRLATVHLGMVDADEAEWQKVDGVGKKGASTLVKAVTGCDK